MWVFRGMIRDKSGTPILPQSKVPDMPRRPDPRNAYLELHYGYYRVTVGVPAQLRSLLGTRLKRCLETKSLLSANVLKKPVVKEFKQRIAMAWESIGGQPRSELQEAVGFSKLLTTAGQNAGQDAHEIRSAILLRAHEILFDGAKERYTDFRNDTDDIEQIYDPIVDDNARRRSELFRSISLGEATPLVVHHEEFIRTLKIKERSKMDDRRALTLFSNWCVANNIPAFIEKIDVKVAVNFKNEIENFTGLGWATCTKYIGRLKVYWDYLMEHTAVQHNVWVGRRLQRTHEYREQKERAFRDIEVRTLLMGTDDRSMLDPMMIAALSGARLDAVIDLRVGECADGWFTFKPQKKEEGARDIPIHPDLEELVLRRTVGRSPEDDLFPEWPLPKTQGSVRERSSYYSKRFTQYRRLLGVTEDIEGKRRSLVNFHSFRRWFVTTGERAKIDGDLLAAIVGHKRSGITLGRYSEGPAIDAAKLAIGKIRLPPLDESPLLEARPLMRRR